MRLSVQLMHQLCADTEAAMLAPDLSNQLLLASARDPGKPSHCLALHSLNPELGLFSPQGRISLPPASSPTPSMAGSGQLKPQVRSSHTQLAAMKSQVRHEPPSLVSKCSAHSHACLCALPAAWPNP